jgi:hypothetical protein
VPIDGKEQKREKLDCRGFAIRCAVAAVPHRRLVITHRGLRPGIMSEASEFIRLHARKSVRVLIGSYNPLSLQTGQLALRSLCLSWHSLESRDTNG